MAREIKSADDLINRDGKPAFPVSAPAFSDPHIPVSGGMSPSPALPGPIQDSPVAGSINDYKDRLVKLIPSEIITAYVTLKGLISGSGVEGNKQLLLWIVFGLLVVMNPLYLYYVTNVRKPGQILFTSFAFVLWVMVIGGTFTTVLGFPAEFLGSVLLVIYTLFIPFVYKG